MTNIFRALLVIRIVRWVIEGVEFNGSGLEFHAVPPHHGYTPRLSSFVFIWWSRGLASMQSGITHIVAVASGKGGVGKSTVAMNLAAALSHRGKAVGLLDADIYGPSQKRMLGVAEDVMPEQIDDKRLRPVAVHGIKAMSMGFLTDEKTAMVWGNLDVLLVDMPPGTGDIQLTLAQKAALSGAIIVTTPQDIALIDAWKGIEMFRKVQVPVLGVVENMSIHVCSACGHEEPVFGQGGGDRLAAEYDVELLARLPLSLAVRESADSGQAMVMAQSDSTEARIFLKIADALVSNLGDASVPTSPTITMGDD